MDEIDLQILKLLQADGRMTNAEIARRVDRAPSAVYERIKGLEEDGVIRGYTARIDPRSVGAGLLAFVTVRSSEVGPEEGAAPALAGIPEVQEVHHVAGEDCFLVKVRTRDTESLGRLLRERIGAIESVESTRTTIVLRTDRETPAVSLDAAGSAGSVSDDEAGA